MACAVPSAEFYVGGGNMLGAFRAGKPLAESHFAKRGLAVLKRSSRGTKIGGAPLSPAVSHLKARSFPCAALAILRLRAKAYFEFFCANDDAHTIPAKLVVVRQLSERGAFFERFQNLEIAITASLPRRHLNSPTQGSDYSG